MFSPPPLPPTREVKGEWSKEPWNHGIFSCANDCAVFCYTCACPFCAVASSRHQFDGSDWLFNFFCINPCVIRSLVRRQYQLEGHYCEDITLSSLCFCCSICQIMNEVESRGSIIETNMSRHPQTLGWNNRLLEKADNPCICCAGFLCYPCLTAHALSKYNGSSVCFNLCCVNQCASRNFIRHGYRINGTCLDDVLAPTFMPCCSALQVYHEVASRSHQRASQRAGASNGNGVSANTINR
ncbi:unnamed protein product [Chrysoparadoxa australica]